MPDTGAPWYIPYVAGTDLVADWPTDAQSLATAIADGLDDAADLSVGLGTNVVQTVKTDQFTTTSAAFVDVTGLAVTITPSSATNKVLVMVTVNVANTGVSTAQVQLLRGATGIGNAAAGFGSGAAGGAPWLSGIVYLDSPATTSATTYKVQLQCGSGTAYVNRSEANNLTVTSTITAIEVAV